MYTVILAKDHHVLLDKAYQIKDWFMQTVKHQKDKRKGKGGQSEGTGEEEVGAATTPSTAASSAGAGHPGKSKDVTINTNPSPYIFAGWMEIMADTLSEEQYAGDRNIKSVLDRIPKFNQEYTEPRMMVRNGIRVARAA